MDDSKYTFYNIQQCDNECVDSKWYISYNHGKT